MADIMKDLDAGDVGPEQDISLAEGKDEVLFDLGVDYAALFRVQTGKDFETGEFIVQ